MVDFSFLEKFTKQDPAKMAKYIRMYLQYAPEIMARMHNDLAGADWASLAINAHSLKPQAEFMGNHELRGLLGEIEDLVRAGSVDSMASVLETASRSHEASMVPLAEALARLEAEGT